jgi:hypothetical protein
MLKKNRLLVFLLVIPIIFITTVTILYSLNHLDSQIFYSLFWGFSISTLNLIMGLTSIHFGLEKSDKLFLIIVFGGLILRLFLMLSLIIIALNFLFVRLNSFIFTTFIFYFYYLLVEIFVLARKKNLIIKTRQ